MEDIVSLEEDGIQELAADAFPDSFTHSCIDDEAPPKSSCLVLEIGESSSSTCTTEMPCSCNSAELSGGFSSSEKEKMVISQDGTKLGQCDRVGLGRRFQIAVSSCDWFVAEILIPFTDRQGLNDFLGVALDAIWLLRTERELKGVLELIKKLIACGATDYRGAMLRTSFLASCVLVCRCRTMSLQDTVNIMAKRLSERLEEREGNAVLKSGAAAKIQGFTEWALNCVGFYSYFKGNNDRVMNSWVIELQLQLSAFRELLDLIGVHLTVKDFTEAFDAACFALTLFFSAIDPGRVSGITSSAIQGFLEILLEWGADDFNRWVLQASCFGSTELVRILLQISQRNNLDVDVDLALAFASRFCKISTIECLVVEGNATDFLGPLMRAAGKGCIQVVKWFVERGCTDMDLCLTLTAAASSSRIEVIDYLLPNVPHHVLSTLCIELIKAAGEQSSDSFVGIGYLMRSNFLRDPEATYAAADCVAKSEDETISPELRAFFHDTWSEDAFLRGRRFGQDHYANVMRVVKRGLSPLSLQDLPLSLQVAIAYLPLYRECIEAGGPLLSQWLRGQLVEAAWRLGKGSFDNIEQVIWRTRNDLLAVLECHIPVFLL
ncbi:ankyrin repeat protein SKIP35-like [Magnolia sinica]|uniref:ankyrin repeat protein SKIP35-like n=1 Tax=Magnolia sinica TaxID=86752 RepID=UPI00265A57FF|nr:ankyrin repeat protein SKIP35-like [Magnolia sinica]